MKLSSSATTEITKRLISYRFTRVHSSTIDLIFHCRKLADGEFLSLLRVLAQDEIAIRIRRGVAPPPTPPPPTPSIPEANPEVLAELQQYPFPVGHCKFALQTTHNSRAEAARLLQENSQTDLEERRRMRDWLLFYPDRVPELLSHIGGRDRIEVALTFLGLDPAHFDLQRAEDLRMTDLPSFAEKLVLETMIRVVRQAVSERFAHGDARQSG
jgi:hypothetical protein